MDSQLSPMSASDGWLRLPHTSRGARRAAAVLTGLLLAALLVLASFGDMEGAASYTLIPSSRPVSAVQPATLSLAAAAVPVPAVTTAAVPLPAAAAAAAAPEADPQGALGAVAGVVSAEAPSQQRSRQRTQRRAHLSVSDSVGDAADTISRAPQSSGSSALSPAELPPRVACPVTVESTKATVSRCLLQTYFAHEVDVYPSVLQYQPSVDCEHGQYLWLDVARMGMGIQLGAYMTSHVTFAALLNLTVVHSPWVSTHVEDESNEARDEALGFGEWEVPRADWMACSQYSPVRQNVFTPSIRLSAQVHTAEGVITQLVEEFATFTQGRPIRVDKKWHTPEERANQSSALTDRLMPSRTRHADHAQAAAAPPKGATLYFKEVSSLESQFHRNSTLVPEIRWWVQRMARILLKEGYTRLLHSTEVVNKSALMVPQPMTPGDHMFLDAKFHVALFLRRGDLVLPLVNPQAGRYRNAPPGSGLVPRLFTWIFIGEEASFKLVREVFLNISAAVRREWVVTIYSLGAPEDFAPLVRRLTDIGVPEVRLALEATGTDVIGRMVASSLAFTAGSTISMALALFDSSSVKLQPARPYYTDCRYYGARTSWPLEVVMDAQPDVPIPQNNMMAFSSRYLVNETVWTTQGASEMTNGTKAKEKFKVTMEGIHTTEYKQTFLFKPEEAASHKAHLRRIEESHGAKVWRLQHGDRPNFLRNYADEFPQEFILDFAHTQPRTRWFPHMWNWYRTHILKRS